MIAWMKHKWRLGKLFAEQDKISTELHRKCRNIVDSTPDKIRSLTAEASSEDSIIREEIVQEVTDYLERRATRMMVFIPDDKEFWDRSDIYKFRILSPKGVAAYKAAIRAERAQAIGVIVPVISTAIGVIGALIGLIAAFRK